MVIVPILILLSCSASAESTAGQGLELPANELVRHIVANELKAEQQDQKPLELPAG